MAVTTREKNKTSVLNSQDNLIGADLETTRATAVLLAVPDLNEPRSAPNLCPARKGEKVAGAGLGFPSLDTSVISRRCLKQRFWANEQSDKAGKTSRRVRRFYQRYFTGVGVGGNLRILSLTTSDEAISQGKDIHRSFEALKKRLRRRWQWFEYIAVKETKGGRKHLHLVFRGKYMEQVQLSALWQAIHISPVVDIRAVYKARGGARYLAKYLAKETLNRYWASYGWVFKGWVGWSKRVNRAIGHYPSRSIIELLAKMTAVARVEALKLLEFPFPALWQYSFEHNKYVVT